MVFEISKIFCEKKYRTYTKKSYCIINCVPKHNVIANCIDKHNIIYINNIKRRFVSIMLK